MPRILSKIYEGIPEGPSDWCLMSGKEGGKEEEVWYFNKRTSEVSKQRPIGLGDRGWEDGKGQGEGGRKEAVLENTKTLDVALTWLDWEFKKADFDKNGILSHHECMAFVRGLRLGLNEKEVSRPWGREEGEGRREGGEEGGVNVFIYPYLLKTSSSNFSFSIPKSPAGRTIHLSGRFQWGRRGGVDRGPGTHPPDPSQALHRPPSRPT